MENIEGIYKVEMLGRHGWEGWRLPPASGRCWLAAFAASPARSDSTPQRLAARCGAVMRGVDMRIKMGEDGDSAVSRGQGIAKAALKKLRGGDFKRDFTGPKGRHTPPRRAPRL